MPLRQPHEWQVDERTRRRKIVRTNPTLELRANGQPTVKWQNGEWYDGGGNLLSPEEVAALPPEYHDRAADYARRCKTIAADGPVVMQTCEFCPEGAQAIPSNQRAQHLAEHVRTGRAELVAQAQSGAAVPRKTAATPTPRARRSPRKRPARKRPKMPPRTVTATETVADGDRAAAN
jgi:hypothetical protein